jgi:hypothetical protein
VPLRRQVPRHWKAHDTEPDERHARHAPPPFTLVALCTP